MIDTAERGIVISSILVTFYFFPMWAPYHPFWPHLLGDQNGFRIKSLKARHAELGNVYTCLLNEPQMKHPLSGGSGGLPPEMYVLASGVANDAYADLKNGPGSWKKV